MTCPSKATGKSQRHPPLIGVGGLRRASVHLGAIPGGSATAEQAPIGSTQVPAAILQSAAAMPREERGL